MSARQVRKAVLPAAGMGARLRPLTHVIPKEMLPVGGEVVLQHVYRECDAAGLDALLVVLNREKLALTAVDSVTPCETDAATKMARRRVHYVEQRPLGGLAHSVLHGEDFVGPDHFAVVLADTIISGEPGGFLRRLIDAHLQAEAAVTLGVQRVPREMLCRYGILEPEGAVGPTFRVRRVVEKPDPDDAPSEYAISARYVFSPEIFPAIRAVIPAEGEIDLTAAITHLAEAGRPVIAVALEEDEKRLDIGNPESYFAAFRELSGSGD